MIRLLLVAVSLWAYMLDSNGVMVGYSRWPTRKPQGGKVVFGPSKSLLNRVLQKPSQDSEGIRQWQWIGGDETTFNRSNASERWRIRPNSAAQTLQRRTALKPLARETVRLYREVRDLELLEPGLWSAAEMAETSAMRLKARAILLNPDQPAEIESLRESMQRWRSKLKE